MAKVDKRQLWFAEWIDGNGDRWTLETGEKPVVAEKRRACRKMGWPFRAYLVSEWVGD